MNAPMNLADRYRRLLAWYPKDHRDRHGEEMLGVLLAGAGDRDRPSRRETVDVLRGALRLHLRRAMGADGGIDHRDVLAIVSLLGPIVLLAGAVAGVERLHPAVFRHPPTSLWTYLIYMPDAPVYLMWSVVAVLALCRLRVAAAAGAWLGTFAFLPATMFSYLPFWEDVAEFSGWFLLSALTAVALTWSPGPARGWALVGGPRVALLVTAVAASGVLVLKSVGTFGVLRMVMADLRLAEGTSRVLLWFVAVAVLVAGAVVACGVRSREGRRAALVLSVPAVVSLLMVVLPPDRGFLPFAAGLCFAVPLVLLVVFGGLPRGARVRA